MVPAMGESTRPGVLSGSIAMPGPTSPSEKTGSGTEPSRTATPATGARTVVTVPPRHAAAREDGPPARAVRAAPPVRAPSSAPAGSCQP